MKIFKERFRKDERGQFYWGRVYFISDNKERKTKVIWAMSFEWVHQQLLLDKWTDENVEKLLNKIVVQKWKDTGRAVFSHKTQYDPWSTDDKENAALMKFIIERSEADKCG